jgi:hypothetical protein
LPPLARWYIKLAMMYLIAGLLVGAIPPLLAAAGPAYVHMLVVGWVTQMIFGVAYWMFPKQSRELPRGDNAVAIATFVLLNVGLALRVIIEPLRAWHPHVVPGWPLLVAAIAQAAAGIGFAISAWPRVKIR